MCKLIPFIFLLIAACGGTVSNDPVTPEVPDPEPTEESTNCYANTPSEVRNHLNVIGPNRYKWDTPPIIQLTDNVPDSDVPIIKDVVRNISKAYPLTLSNVRVEPDTEEHGYITIDYADDPDKPLGEAKTSKEDGIIESATVTIYYLHLPDPGDFIQTYLCDESKEWLIAHELLHALGMSQHFPGSRRNPDFWTTTNTILYKLIPPCGNTRDRAVAHTGPVPSTLDLDSLRLLYNVSYEQCTPEED